MTTDLSKIKSDNAERLPPLPIIDGLRFCLIPDAFGYAACDDGTIWTCKTIRGRISQWRRKTTMTHAKGYQLVNFSINNVSRRYLVHRIIATCFIGPCPSGLVCCHKDGNPCNNKPDNLRWDTNQSNSDDMVKHGRNLPGEKHPQAKLNEKTVRAIREAHRRHGNSVMAVMREFGLSRGVVQDVVAKRRWGHVV